MCEPVTILAGIAAVVGAVGAAQAKKTADAAAGEARIAGNAKLYEGELDNALRGADADQVLTQSQKEADQIKRQALNVRSQMHATQSASGVMIGEGSAQAAVDQLDALSSADALATLYSGTNKATAVRTNGKFSARQGENANAAAARTAASMESAGKVNAAVGIGNAVTKGLSAGYGK